jgi:hypothetical protein
MKLEPGTTKQGLRDLNVLYPKKRKPRPGDEPQAANDGGPAPAPETAVAEAVAVAPTPLP